MSEAELPDPVLVVCQHLNGPEYEEYILRTQTRSLGGISPTFRAQTARSVFPYKPFPPMQDREVRKEEARTKQPPIKLIPFAECATPPKTGNAKLEEKYWTPEEQRYFDDTLKGFARWEVDYAHRFVKATTCAGTTINENAVCDECQDLAETNTALKKALYRVSRDDIGKHGQTDEQRADEQGI